MESTNFSIVNFYYSVCDSCNVFIVCDDNYCFPFIMQFTKQTPEDLAAMAEARGVKVLIPHHMDLAMSEDVYLPRIEEMKRAVHARVPGCSVITRERLKWYHMGLSVWA